jgi:lipopolysaccharide transport system ATP-binding protein
MGSIIVSNLGKAYKQYPNRWARLFDWFDTRNKVHYEHKWVLQGINFTVEPGESLGFMGVNGAGKSTLLKMITGTTRPTIGSVHISGRVVALLELGMGFHPDFTGRQNAFMASQLLGFSVEEIHRLMPEIETFAEIGDYIDKPVRVYSSGMQVRLAFAVATAVQPDVLIVDEALAVGDAYFQAKCFSRIKQYKKNGTTLLYVSHSPGDVVKHCERAILLKNGVVAMDGSSRDVSNCYLDELFGKRLLDSNSPKQSTALLTADSFSDLMPCLTDVFATRPGYRKEEHRWGQGGAAILDFLIINSGQHYPSRVEGNSLTDFYMKVRFDADYESVVPGFLIKTIEGIFLYGTNSFISNIRNPRLSTRSGDFHIFRFSLPMMLNEGNYLISLGVSSGDPMEELVPLDRRYDSILINVGRELQFWGIVDLAAKFECIDSGLGVNK